jgi:hypothetical protein
MNKNEQQRTSAFGWSLEKQESRIKSTAASCACCVSRKSGIWIASVETLKNSEFEKSLTGSGQQPF